MPERRLKEKKPLVSWKPNKDGVWKRRKKRSSSATSSDAERLRKVKTVSLHQHGSP